MKIQYIYKNTIYISIVFIYRTYLYTRWLAELNGYLLKISLGIPSALTMPRPSWNNLPIPGTASTPAGKDSELWVNFHCRNHPLTRENKESNWGQRGNLLGFKEFAPLVRCGSRAKCTPLMFLTLIPLLLSWPAGLCQPTPLLAGSQRASAE